MARNIFALCVIVWASMFAYTATASSHPVVSVPDSVMRLTPEGEAYRLSISGARVSIDNINSGHNNRDIFWDKDSPDYTASKQCMTWVSGSEFAQSGIVFRMQQQADGYNAIVFARNIFMNWYWVFAPKMFHTSSDYEHDWDSPAGVDLSSYLGASQVEQVWPLRVCASLDSDDVLRFAVAKASDRMPPLTNPGIQGGSWRLDMAEYYHADEGRKGKNGIFAGHVPNGTSLVFDGIVLSGLSKD